jgi:AcrR family transcriptional regulator
LTHFSSLFDLMQVPWEKGLRAVRTGCGCRGPGRYNRLQQAVPHGRSTASHAWKERMSRSEVAENQFNPKTARKRTATGTVKPKGQWHHGDLRASLIAWGTHLLDTEGIDGMSMRAAAKLAGVSQGAPAHHFQDRNGLLAAIAAQGFRDMVSLRKKRLDEIDPNDAPGRLRAVMLAYVEFAQAHPARFHLMYGPQIEHHEQFPELLEAGAASFELLKSVVTPFLTASEAEALSVEKLAFAVWAATHGLATLTVHGRNMPPSGMQRPTSDQLSDIVVNFCLSALRAAAKDG